MFGYILRRLLQVIPVFFGATLLIYFMVFALPGDPIIALFGDKTPNPAVVEQLRAQYHLDQPFIVQYFYYITGIFQGLLLFYLLAADLFIHYRIKPHKREVLA